MTKIQAAVTSQSCTDAVLPADPAEWTREQLQQAMTATWHPKYREDISRYYSDLLDDLLDQDLPVRLAQLHLHIQDAQVWMQWLIDRRDDVLRAKIRLFGAEVTADALADLLSIPVDEAQALIDSVR